MAEQYETLEEFLDAEEIEQQDEDTLFWVALGLAYGIDVFASRIEREIAVLRGSGVGDRAIIQILSDDLRTGGRIFGEFRNTIKRGIVGGIMQGFRVGQDNIYGDNVMMRWVSTEALKYVVIVLLGLVKSILGRTGKSLVYLQVGFQSVKRTAIANLYQKIYLLTTKL